MGAYGLEFIADNDLFAHVKETVEQYRFQINLKEFNQNLVDPIKLTFDAKIYGKTIEEIIETEVIRQIDKSNTNHIGYFHQNIFRYQGNGWNVPEKGYDVINHERKIFVEMKNKHNTMNSSSAQKTYMKMQNKILRDDEAVCYLVEVIAKKSQDMVWNISLDGEPIANKRIRRISIDKFYELVTGLPTAFYDLCRILPQVIEDVVVERGTGKIVNSVFAELQELSPDLIKSIYLLAFRKYAGFAALEFE